MGLFTSHKKDMVDAERALPGRDEAMAVTSHPIWSSGPS